MTTLKTGSWQRMETLFREAAARPAAGRAAFLRDACGTDQDLCDKLLQMLQEHDGQGLLDAAPVTSAEDGANGPSGTLIGRRIGQFTVLRTIASGGMGVVYEARQEHPSRSVALKVLHRHLLNRESLARFKFEAEALGRLHHPAIAQIFEAGVFDSDAGPQPYLAMELVNGLPLTDFAQRNKLGLRQRLALMIRVCEGVEHAHRHGVVHRDLKPANILVCDEVRATTEIAAEAELTAFHSIGQPRILDFGIARTSDPEAQMTLRTSPGQLIGTLNYMSPEQVEGDPTRIDGRCDVYALGIIAFELLSGRTPHDLGGLSVPEAARVIRQDEHARLSSIDRVYRGDLETIINKALEKDPARRYQTAAQFADDLRRFLRDEPVHARPPTTFYQLRKFALRNKALVGAVAAIFIALALGAIGIVWQWRHAVMQRDLAREAEKVAATRLEQVIGAAQTIMDAVDAELLNLPGNTGVRITLAEQALKHVEALPQEGLVLHSTGYAHQRLGEAYAAAGRTAEALVCYQNALAVRRPVAEEHPTDPSSVRPLAVGHWKVAEVMLVMGRFDEALDHNQQALALLGQLSAEADDQSSYLGYLGIGFRRLAEVRAELGQHEQAIADLRTSLGHFDRYFQSGTMPLTPRRSATMAWRALGQSLAATGQFDAAWEALDRSRALTLELAREQGQADVWERSHETRIDLACVDVLARRDKSTESIAFAAHAVALAEGLSAADAMNAESRALLGRSLATLARLRSEAGDSAGARESAKRAALVLEELCTHDPVHRGARLDLAAARQIIDDDQARLQNPTGSGR